MTTNKPEVVAYLHTNKENPEHRGVILHHDASCTSTLTNTEPLIRLSDYEALQVECERLRKLHQDAYQRGFHEGSRGLREAYNAIQEVKRQDAWGNAQLTEAQLAAEDRAERMEIENAALTAENERLSKDISTLVEALECIASWPNGGNRSGQTHIQMFAAKTLATYRKQGGEV